MTTIDEATRHGGVVFMVKDQRPRRLRFLRNTCYEGKDYGPGLPAGDICEVEAGWADIFLRNGRAVIAPPPVELNLAVLSASTK
jgi:hypothetical protein